MTSELVPLSFYCSDVPDYEKLRMAEKILLFEADETCLNVMALDSASLCFLLYHKFKSLFIGQDSHVFFPDFEA